MKKNVNTVDALMRLTLGITGVAWGTSEMIRRPNSMTAFLVTAVSALKAAEGITRYCPMVALLDKTSAEMMNQEEHMEDQSMEQERNQMMDKVNQTMNKTLRGARKIAQRVRKDMDMDQLEKFYQDENESRNQGHYN